MPIATELLDKYKKACSLASDNACAKKLAVSRAAVSQWRKGTHAPDITALEKMCEATGESITHWVGVIGSERAVTQDAKRAWLKVAGIAATLVLAVYTAKSTTKNERPSSRIDANCLLCQIIQGGTIPEQMPNGCKNIFHQETQMGRPRTRLNWKYDPITETFTTPQGVVSLAELANYRYGWLTGYTPLHGPWTGWRLSGAKLISPKHGERFAIRPNIGNLFIQWARQGDLFTPVTSADEHHPGLPGYTCGPL